MQLWWEDNALYSMKAISGHLGLKSFFREHDFVLALIPFFFFDKAPRYSNPMHIAISVLLTISCGCFVVIILERVRNNDAINIWARNLS